MQLYSIGCTMDFYCMHHNICFTLFWNTFDSQKWAGQSILLYTLLSIQMYRSNIAIWERWERKAVKHFRLYDYYGDSMTDTVMGAPLDVTRGAWAGHIPLMLGKRELRQRVMSTNVNFTLDEGKSCYDFVSICRSATTYKWYEVWTIDVTIICSLTRCSWFFTMFC